jgi:hypothetical protein
VLAPAAPSCASTHRGATPDTAPPQADDDTRSPHHARLCRWLPRRLRSPSSAAPRAPLTTGPHGSEPRLWSVFTTARAAATWTNQSTKTLNKAHARRRHTKCRAEQRRVGGGARGCSCDPPLAAAPRSYVPRDTFHLFRIYPLSSVPRDTPRSLRSYPPPRRPPAHSAHTCAAVHCRHLRPMHMCMRVCVWRTSCGLSSAARRSSDSTSSCRRALRSCAPLQLSDSCWIAYVYGTNAPRSTNTRTRVSQQEHIRGGGL